MKSLLIYWKHILETGMVMPVPLHVIEKMAAGAHLKTAKAVVEFGPGDGKITKELLKQMPDDSKYYAFEVNEELVEILAKKVSDPRLVIIASGAQSIRAELQKHGVEQVDYIFSSMPMSFLKGNEFEQMMTDCRDLLTESGAFIQYQYSLKTLAVLKKLFTNIKLKFSLFCVPPAFVYICQKSERP